MKKKYRKDVLIARVIFAGICFLLILAVCLIISGIHKKNQQKDKQMQQTQAENLPPEIQNTELPPVTEAVQTKIVWTNSGVNFRNAPNTQGKILHLLDPGTPLELVDETDGWARVIYQGTEGYVSMEYITETDPSSQAE